MSKKDYKSSEVYLKRMLEHIEKINGYKKNLTYVVFKQQEQDYDALCMQLSQVGENVSKLEKSSDRIIETFPNEVKWSALKGLRNRIDHDYTWLEVDQLWDMLENNIDELESGVRNILNKRYGHSLK
jgi:uncharacterized protein with HEPN domain